MASLMLFLLFVGTCSGRGKIVVFVIEIQLHLSGVLVVMLLHLCTNSFHCYFSRNKM